MRSRRRRFPQRQGGEQTTLRDWCRRHDKSSIAPVQEVEPPRVGPADRTRRTKRRFGRPSSPGPRAPHSLHRKMDPVGRPQTSVADFGIRDADIGDFVGQSRLQDGIEPLDIDVPALPHAGRPHQTSECLPFAKRRQSGRCPSQHPRCCQRHRSCRGLGLRRNRPDSRPIWRTASPPRIVTLLCASRGTPAAIAMPTPMLSPRTVAGSARTAMGYKAKAATASAALSLHLDCIR